MSYWSDPWQPECQFARRDRLAAELAAGPTPGRAAAIRMELDALAPRIAGALRTAAAFAAAWPVWPAPTDPQEPSND